MLKKLFITTSLVLAFAATSVYAQPARPNQPVANPQALNAGSPNVLSPRMKEAIIKQIATEQYSSNLYLTYASYFGDLGLDGSEELFRHASAEETEHALLFYNLLIDRGEKFQLQTVNASANMPTSVFDAYKKHLDNEILVTKSIHNLYNIALEEGDYATQVFLHQFIAMQVQEEKEATDLVQLLELGANDPAFILVFDQKLKEMAEKD